MNFNLQDFLNSLCFALLALILYFLFGYQLTAMFFLIGIISKLK